LRVASRWAAVWLSGWLGAGWGLLVLLGGVAGWVARRAPARLAGWLVGGQAALSLPAPPLPLQRRGLACGGPAALAHLARMLGKQTSAADAVAEAQ
jgi:hypothetical protein